jgi:hypothetical protein
MLCGDGKRYVVVMGLQEVYLDEGGTHDGSPILSVAAFMGDHEKWKSFLAEWGEQPFHAKKNQYDKLKPRLVEVIASCKLQGMVAWLRPEDFRKYAVQELRNNLGNAYAICTVACAIQIWKWVKQDGLGRIAFVLEVGQPNSEWVKRVLESMIDDPHYEGLVASVAVANKADFLQLVTADFLANSNSTEDRFWSARLSEHCDINECHISGDILTVISEEVRAIAKRHRWAKANAKRQRKRGTLS